LRIIIDANVIPIPIESPSVPERPLESFPMLVRY
jgi:hypothetical protein